MDIFDFVPLRDINASINSSFVMIGAGHRGIVKYSPSDTVLKFSLSFIFNISQLRAFESFFIAKKARYESFFMRSMRVDFENVKASSGILLTSSTNKTYGAYARKLYIYNRRTKKVYEISNAINDNSGDQIYLKAGIDEFEDGDECENCYKVRFDSDTLRATKQSPTRYKIDIAFKEVICE